MDPTEMTAVHSNRSSSTSSIGAKHSASVCDETQHIYFGPCTSKNANYFFTTTDIYVDNSARSFSASMIAPCRLLSIGVSISHLNSINFCSMSDDYSTNNSITVVRQFNKCPTTTTTIWPCTAASVSL